jgi:hypothetical protein
VRIHNARKCGLYETLASESRGPLYRSRAMVSKVRSADPEGSVEHYISVMATLKFTFFLIQGIRFVKNNGRTSLTGTC